MLKKEKQVSENEEKARLFERVKKGKILQMSSGL
jgi:hypothetical protein